MPAERGKGESKRGGGCWASCELTCAPQRLGLGTYKGRVKAQGPARDLQALPVEQVADVVMMASSALPAAHLHAAQASPRRFGDMQRDSWGMVLRINSSRAGRARLRQGSLHIGPALDPIMAGSSLSLSSSLSYTHMHTRT